MAIATVNPSTGDTEKTFTAHDEAEVERRIAQAHAAHEKLRATSFAQRAQWARATADVLEGDVDELARIITVEMGKPIEQSRAEITKSANALRFYAEHAEGFLADEVLEDPSAVGASRAYARYRPLGLVLAVMPWNFPVWQVIRFAAPALMAGNTGVLKHASNVPQTALFLDELFERGGFPAGVFRTLLIGSTQVDAVIRDARVKAVTLTGSEPAGQAVAATAGEEIKTTVLELGGSDPFIVMPSADLDAAVDTAVDARMMNNGQSCIAAKRFIIHADVYEQFTERFTAKVRELRVGDPLDAQVDVGPLASQGGVDDLAELVDDAVATGASVLVGGPDAVADVPGEGFYYPPTVIADLPEQARMTREETFGPVAALYKVADAQQAVRVANATSFGLSSAVWTTDAQEQEYFVQEVQAGGVFVNGMTVSNPALPFGGIKRSGYGRELSAAGIREFCNLTTVWVA
ncbi:NADP-dependent succinic semialdehyde dehydrogenase [Brachybacterium muris]|uniref:NADP-dependent succinic semialdehyde dehydrogenase n=1 Tax=Brachybacterium muris TaxID=219301 RepID=UPI00223B065F|nr:NADP-dependent succinic semialdehyde dehydrogenase [Brachybacterium muris]MCT1653592.1 NADP-dependent succinic semialdehyde dehydrogenase [Brachybacterium muris]